MAEQKIVVADPWAKLRAFTRARIALGRAGSSLPTDEVLRFAYAHALARDAVHRPLDAAGFCQTLAAAGFDTLPVSSAAADRSSYLLRPDLGRRLDDASAALLQQHAGKGCDVLLMAGDGLSSLAVSQHAQPLLEAMRMLLPASWSIGPLVVATQARVALSDEVGELLRARLVVLLIGERPGLSSPDSLGIYITFAPRVGRQDAERNCISNVRPEGLGYAAAARKALWLATEALRLQLSGINLKDQSDIAEIGTAEMPALPERR